MQKKEFEQTLFSDIFYENMFGAVAAMLHVFQNVDVN